MTTDVNISFNMQDLRSSASNPNLVSQERPRPTSDPVNMSPVHQQKIDDLKLREGFVSKADESEYFHIASLALILSTADLFCKEKCIQSRTWAGSKLLTLWTCFFIEAVLLSAHSICFFCYALSTKGMHKLYSGYSLKLGKLIRLKRRSDQLINFWRKNPKI